MPPPAHPLLLRSRTLRRSPAVVAYYRPGTSDERVISEVADRRGYVRVRDGFDVEVGERWLDLGANVGAFAIYCRLRGATALSVEPDPENYRVLLRNVSPIGPRPIRAAVTDRPDSEIEWFVSPDRSMRHTGCVTGGARLVRAGRVPNLHAAALAAGPDGRGSPWDGIKVDIEGAEFALLDAGLLPPTRKFVFEYHSRKDPSVANLARRLDYLRSRFRVVRYPPEFDRRIAAGKDGKTYYDRLVHCWNPR